jgi:hypothetical protein
MAGMGRQTCVHPNSNATDDIALPGTGPGYDTRHNPFIYFHSLLDLGDCASDDQDLSRLPSALSRASRTATLSYIAPGECADAAATAAPTSAGAGTTTTTTSTTTTSGPITTTTAASTSSSEQGTTTTASPASARAGCPAGQPVGLAAEDAFLRLWVPRILASPAYRHGGVLIIEFAGVSSTARAAPTGALVLSRYARRGAVVSATYTPYSLVRSVEDMLGSTPLAHARSAASFAQAVLRINR